MVNQNRAASPLNPNAINNTVSNNNNLSSLSPSGKDSNQSANNNNNTNNTNSGQRSFYDNFWGEKINGFDVLCLNLKHSLTNVKELETFVRECSNCEDSYGKSLNKLVTQVNKFSSNGTFNPVWSPIKELNEKYASLHVQQFHQLQELIKEIQRYNEELGKRIKRIRENETQTQNVVQMFQDITQTLNKAREQYHNVCSEYEKQKRQLDNQQLMQYQQLSSQQLQQQISTTNLLSKFYF
jgi:chromosome segregation ATPase